MEEGGREGMRRMLREEQSRAGRLGESVCEKSRRRGRGIVVKLLSIYKSSRSAAADSDATLLLYAANNEQPKPWRYENWLR